MSISWVLTTHLSAWLVAHVVETGDPQPSRRAAPPWPHPAAGGQARTLTQMTGAQMTGTGATVLRAEPRVSENHSFKQT